MTLALSMNPPGAQRERAEYCSVHISCAPWLQRQLTAAFLSLCLLICQLKTQGVMSLGCYVCTSFNNTNRLCEDPFHTHKQEAFDFYNTNCMGYRKDRAGYFPADHCIKVQGNSTDNPAYSIMIRTCSVDSGSMTSDSEIVRISHCGHFTYNSHYFKGCVQSCQYDGCNHATAPRRVSILTPTISSILSTKQHFLAMDLIWSSAMAVAYSSLTRQLLISS